MLPRQEFVQVQVGTSEEIIDAATLGARINARRLLALGLEYGSIRRQVLDWIDADLVEEGINPWCRETVLSAVSLAIDDVLEISDVGEEYFDEDRLDFDPL